MSAVNELPTLYGGLSGNMLIANHFIRKVVSYDKTQQEGLKGWLSRVLSPIWLQNN